MKKTIAISSILAFVGAITSASAAQREFYKESDSCGSQSTAYLCLTVTQGGTAGVQYISNFKVSFTGSGLARVTWNGSVYCEIRGEGVSGTFSGSLLEYYIHMSLKDDKSPIDYNSPGSISAGERLQIIAYNPASANNEIQGRRTLLVPITINKSFKIKGSDNSKNFRLAVLPDWRSGGSGFCNINGGAISVDYKPD